MDNYCGCCAARHHLNRYVVSYSRRKRAARLGYSCTVRCASAPRSEQSGTISVGAPANHATTVQLFHFVYRHALTSLTSGARQLRANRKYSRPHSPSSQADFPDSSPSFQTLESDDQLQPHGTLILSFIVALP